MRESKDLQTRQILRIDHANRMLIGVQHHQVIDAMVLEDLKNLGRQLVALDRDRLERHEISDRTRADVRIFGKVTREIAVGENAGERSVLVNNHGSTGAVGGHGLNGFQNRGVRWDDRQIRNRTHDLMDLEKQGAAEASTGMELGEILFLKPPGFE